MEENKTKKCGRPSKRKTAKSCSGSCTEGCKAAADETKAPKAAPEAAKSGEDIIEKLIKDNILTPDSLIKALNKLTGANISLDDAEETLDDRIEFEEDSDTAITHGVFEGPLAVSRVIEIEGVGQLIALPFPGAEQDSDTGAANTAYYWVEAGRAAVPAAIASDLAAPAAALGIKLEPVGELDDDADVEEDCDDDDDELDAELSNILNRIFAASKPFGRCNPKVCVLRV